MLMFLQLNTLIASSSLLVRLPFDLEFVFRLKHSLGAIFTGATTWKDKNKIQNRKVVELGGKVIFVSLYIST